MGDAQAQDRSVLEVQLLDEVAAMSTYAMPDPAEAPDEAAAASPDVSSDASTGGDVAVPAPAEEPTVG